MCDEGQRSASLCLSDQAMSTLGFETGSLTGLVSSRLTLGQGAPGIHFYRLPQYLFKMFGEDTFPPPPQVIGIITLTPAIVVCTFSYTPAIKTVRLEARHTKLRLRQFDLVVQSPLIS